MERELKIRGRIFLVSKTRQTPFINGRPYQEICIRKQILNEFDQPNGYHLTRDYVPLKATWKEIEAYITENHI